MILYKWLLVFANYEKQHSNRTYDYLKENNLLITQTVEDTIPVKELEKIINNIKRMYKEQDDKLIKVLKMVA